MGPYPLPDLRRMRIHEAMDEFQDSASSIRLNKENNTAVIRWGNEYQVKDRSSAVRMAQRKMKALVKWSEKRKKSGYSGSWCWFRDVTKVVFKMLPQT